MIPELLLLAAGALGSGGLGATWWARRAQRRHVIAVRTAWVRAGRIVRWGPVGAVCLGHWPRQTYGRGASGALGLADEALVFEGHRRRDFNASVALRDLRRIGLVRVTTRAGRIVRRRQALAVHYETPDGWRVATFALEMPRELAAVLGDEAGLPVHDSGDARDDFGPAPATRMVQDVYGEWTPDRPGQLYLAPDRLLFNWRDAIPVARIRRLDAYTQPGAWRLRSGELLRVEYAQPDGASAAVGFLVRRADRWAQAIVQRGEVPLAVHGGRKKKAD